MFGISVAEVVNSHLIFFQAILAKGTEEYQLVLVPPTCRRQSPASEDAVAAFAFSTCGPARQLFFVCASKQQHPRFKLMGLQLSSFFNEKCY